MEENSNNSSRRIIMLKKGEHVPSNASQLSEDEILNIQQKRIEDFKPPSEMRVFKYSPHIIGLSVGFTGCVINSIYRRNFRLGGLKMLLTYGPSTVLPGVLSVGVHEISIKKSILLGQEQCPSCVTIRSGVLQVIMGLFYPCMVSVLTCLPVAREFYTLPMPTAQRGVGYLKLLQKVSPPASSLLLLGAINMLIGAEISRRELKAYVKHLSKPPNALDDVEIFNEDKTF